MKAGIKAKPPELVEAYSWLAEEHVPPVPPGPGGHSVSKFPGALGASTACASLGSLRMPLLEHCLCFLEQALLLLLLPSRLFQWFGHFNRCVNEPTQPTIEQAASGTVTYFSGLQIIVSD